MNISITGGALAIMFMLVSPVIASAGIGHTLVVKDVATVGTGTSCSDRAELGDDDCDGYTDEERAEKIIQIIKGLRNGIDFDRPDNALEEKERGMGAGVVSEILDGVAPFPIVIEMPETNGTVKWFNETKSNAGDIDNAPEEKERGIAIPDDQAERRTKQDTNGNNGIDREEGIVIDIPSAGLRGTVKFFNESASVGGEVIDVIIRINGQDI